MNRAQAKGKIKGALHALLKDMKTDCACMAANGSSPSCRNGCVDEKKYLRLREAVKVHFRSRS